MKEKLYKVIGWIIAIGAVVGIGEAFWYFSDPVKFPMLIYPKCESGWFIERRFGNDVFVGSEKKALERAGGSRIYYAVNKTLDCK